MAAGVYAARKKIKSALVTYDFGGQSVVSPDVQNFIGITSLPGTELTKRFKEHLQAYASDVLNIVEGEKITSLKQIEGGFEAESNKGNKYQARAVMVGSGSSRRKLKVEGAERLDNKGISYCASCDAPLFKDMKVAVIGGGNAGFEAAQQLLDYATEVTLLEAGDKFKADPITVENVSKSDKFKAVKNVEVTEIKGDKFVSGLIYRDKEGKGHELELQGVFVEIGSIPNSGFAKDLVDVNNYGEIVIDHKYARTSKEGIWAAGDVSDVPYKQNNISMGDGVKALEDIYLWLNKNK